MSVPDSKKLVFAIIAGQVFVMLNTADVDDVVGVSLFGKDGWLEVVEAYWEAKHDDAGKPSN